MRHHPPGRLASVRQRSDDHATHCTNYLRDVEHHALEARIQITEKTLTAHDSSVITVVHMSFFHEKMNSARWSGKGRESNFMAVSTLARCVLVALVRNVLLRPLCKYHLCGFRAIVAFR